MEKVGPKEGENVTKIVLWELESELSLLTPNIVVLPKSRRESKPSLVVESPDSGSREPFESQHGPL